MSLQSGSSSSNDDEHSTDEGEESSDLFNIDELLEVCNEEDLEIFARSRRGKTSVEKKVVNVGKSTGNASKSNVCQNMEKAVEVATFQEAPVDTYGEFSPTPKTITGKAKRKRAINFQKRMNGESYVGFDTVIGAKKRRLTPQTKERKAREMGSPCISKLCARRLSRSCSEFSPQIREQLFEEFWKKMNWDEKRAYVRSHVDQRTPARRSYRDHSEHRKEDTFLYHLKFGGVRRQVCRKMFLSTLGIGRSQVRGWLTNTDGRKPTTRDESDNNGGNSIFARKYLTDIPKLPSHYCRQNTAKLYLEPLIRSKLQLYKLYKEKCSEESVDPVSIWKLNKLFTEMNLSIHQPKKDRCDCCCSFEAGLTSEDDYKIHIENKNAARAQKTSDKNMALQGLCHVVTMDVESVLLSPVLNASALYYKTKLAVHNFTIYNLKTKHAKCFLWDETQAELVASVFASCLVSYLEDNFKDNIPIIIYSDACTNQNRNAVLSNALLQYAMKNKKVVIQKYLEKGHTQMEVDSVHATIEQHLKGRSIYIPADYVKICKEARSFPMPYDVEYLNFTDFKNYSIAKNMRYPSIRPGNKSGDPHVTDIRQIRYNVNGTIDYKIAHKNDFLSLPRTPRNISFSHLRSPSLYNCEIPITKRKYQDLMDLLHVIPEEYHDFYRSLPFNK